MNRRPDTDGEEVGPGPGTGSTFDDRRSARRRRASHQARCRGEASDNTAASQGGGTPAQANAVHLDAATGHQLTHASRPGHSAPRRPVDGSPRRLRPYVPAIRRSGIPRRRLIAALVVLSLLLVAVIVRVAILKTTDAESFRSAGAEQWTRTTDIDAQRGTIFDRHGNELAMSVPAASISINPKLLENGPATVQILGDLLDTARRVGRIADGRGHQARSRTPGLRVRRTTGRRRPRRSDPRARALPASTSTP